MIGHYLSVFGELIVSPFNHTALIWGIVPLYFGLLLNELTGGKASYRTAVQTGFSFIWAAIQWIYPYFKPHGSGGPRVEWNAMTPVNLFVTATVVIFGLLALISGLRRKYPKYCSFLGYTRFSNYFMIAIFPIQAQALEWTWDRLIAIALFGVPIWIVLHFGLMPLRK
jgi:hypothetical protein